MERTSGSVGLQIENSGKENIRKVFHVGYADGVSFQNGLHVLPFCMRCTKNISVGKGTCGPEKENSGFACDGIAVFCYAEMLRGMTPREKMRPFGRTVSPLPAASCVVNGPGILFRMF